MTDKNRADELRKMLRQVAPEGDLEQLKVAFGSDNCNKPPITNQLQAGFAADDDGDYLDIGVQGTDEDFALETLDTLIKSGIDSPLDDDQQDALEAIVLTRYRPVIDIIGDSFSTPPSPWQDLGIGETKSRIEAVIQSIGRIEIPNHPQFPFVGTGFIVGKDLIMTNRHVAEVFATGIGQTKLIFRPGQKPMIDLKQEVVPVAAKSFGIERVVMIHPYWDMALLRVNGIAADPLEISTEHPSNLQDRNIVVIGYPAQDPRNNVDLQNRIFRGIFNVKRLQPGKLKVQREVTSFGRRVNAVTHDSSTLGGNSGSALIDVNTGQVVGLHFAGLYLDANFAVPTIDLASDERVVSVGINFANPVPPSDIYPPIWKLADAGDLV